VKRVTFIIPKNDNNGAPFPTATIAEIRKDILRNFGGYTVRDVRGEWIDSDGKTYQDDNWEYTIVMEEKEVEKVESILAKAKRLLSQQAMWLEVSDTEARLV
jgi:hypothetical protein